MKKLFLVAVILLSSVVLSHAQIPDLEEIVKQNVDWVKTFLTLTSDQTDQVSSIFLIYTQKQFTVFEQTNGDFSKIEEKFQQLNTEQDAALGKVLSKEQLDIYKKKFQEKEAYKNISGF
jgi:hypothetical protein